MVFLEDVLQEIEPSRIILADTSALVIDGTEDEALNPSDANKHINALKELYLRMRFYTTLNVVKEINGIALNAMAFDDTTRKYINALRDMVYHLNENKRIISLKNLNEVIDIKLDKRIISLTNFYSEIISVPNASETDKEITKIAFYLSFFCKTGVISIDKHITEFLKGLFTYFSPLCACGDEIERKYTLSQDDLFRLKMSDITLLCPK